MKHYQKSGSSGENVGSTKSVLWAVPEIWIFAVFVQISRIIFEKRTKIIQPTIIVSRNNLNHLEDTLGDLEPQLGFYQKDGVGGPNMLLD